MALAFKLPFAVKDTSASTGDSGTIVAAETAIDGFNAFADALADGDEIVLGRDDDDGATGATEREELAVTWDETNHLFTVLAAVESTNGGSRVDWPSGTTNLFPTLPGARIVVRNNDGNALDGIGRCLSFEPAIDLGTKSSGSLSPSTEDGVSRLVTCGGAFTLNAPADEGIFLLCVVNNASAGTITLSGFDWTDGSLDTSDGNVFYIVMVNNGQEVFAKIMASGANS